MGVCDSASNRKREIEVLKERNRVLQEKIQNLQKEPSITSFYESTPARSQNKDDENDENESQSVLFSATFSHASSKRVNIGIGRELGAWGLTANDENTLPKTNIANENNAEILINSMNYDNNKMMKYFSKHLDVFDLYELHENQCKIRLSKLNQKELQQMCDHFNINYDIISENMLMDQVFLAWRNKIYTMIINDTYTNDTYTKQTKEKIAVLLSNNAPDNLLAKSSHVQPHNYHNPKKTNQNDQSDDSDEKAHDYVKDHHECILSETKNSQHKSDAYSIEYDIQALKQEPEKNETVTSAKENSTTESELLKATVISNDKRIQTLCNQLGNKYDTDENTNCDEMKNDYPYNMEPSKKLTTETMFGDLEKEQLSNPKQCFQDNTKESESLKDAVIRNDKHQTECVDNNPTINEDSLREDSNYSCVKTEDKKITDYDSFYGKNKKPLLDSYEKEFSQICEQFNVKYDPNHKQDAQLLALMNKIWNNHTNKPNELCPKDSIITCTGKGNAGNHHVSANSSGDNSLNSNNSSNSKNSQNPNNNNRNNDNNKSNQNKQPNDNHEHHPYIYNKNVCNIPEHLQKLCNILCTQRDILYAIHRLLNKDDTEENTNCNEMKNDYPYNMKPSKPLTTETMFRDVVKELLSNPNQCFQNIYSLYGDQIFKTYQIGDQSIAIANYDIHCRETNEQLYNPWEIKNGRYKQTNELYTAETIQQKYKITAEILPRISRPSPNLIPDRDLMRNMICILQEKENREKIIDKTKWTCKKKVPVHKTTTDEQGARGFSEIFEIELDIFKNIMKKFSNQIAPAVNESKDAEADDMKEQQPYKRHVIQLIPFIQANKDPIHVQYLWVVSLEFKNIKFCIGISLELPKNDRCKTPLKVSGVFLSFTDGYQLIPPECKTHTTLRQFVENHIPVNKLTIIGTGHEQQITQQQNEIVAMRKLMIMCCRNNVALQAVLSHFDNN